MRASPVLFVLGCLLGVAGVQLCAAASPAQAALEQMSRTERENSCISVEFGSRDSESVRLGHDVERLWNGGQFDEALAQLGGLETRVGRVAIGNSWRDPVPTLPADTWGTDVRIGNRDSLQSVALTLDPYTNNLFAVLRHSAGTPQWSVCMSRDYGATWRETFTWVGSPTTCVAATAFWYLVVTYSSPGEDAQQVRARRFLCLDGSADTFSSDQYWVAACTLNVGDTLKEASLVRFRRAYRLYAVFLVSSGSVLLRYSWFYGAPWNPWAEIASGARCGLASDGDLDADTLYFSYCDATDSLRICRSAGDSLAPRYALPAGSGIASSISTCHDTVICAFEDRASSPPQVRYVVNYDNGDTWTTGTFGSADTAADSPCVLAENGRFAAVFRQGASTRELRFSQRPYVGSWSDPLSVADNEPGYGRPELVYLGSGLYGLAYLSDTSPVAGGAYFDRTDWAYGVAEQHQPQAASLERQATVVRGVLFLDGLGTRSELPERNSVMSRASLLDISGRKVMDLKPGGNDVRMLPAGVYFVRQAANKAKTKIVVER